MDGFSLLSASLGYVDSSQEVEWNSLHAERGIGKGEGSGIMHIRYIKLNFFAKFLRPPWSSGYHTGIWI